MIQKFNIGFITFSYGGNGGISSEVPNIREWMTPTAVELSRDPRIDNIRIWNLADTPITMTRNRAVLQARHYGLDILVMIDSDMWPDNVLGSPGSKPFIQSSLDFLIDHYPKGPVVIGAPYCGPPPHECVYVFRWQNMQSEHPGPDYQLEMYDRHTAAGLSGIQPCAALPTGLIMYDMRAFDITEPKTEADKPWFYYEWKDKYAAEKASTEDVTMTRDLSLAAVQSLGYSPVFCNWDAWAGHWKPKCVSKPVVITPEQVSDKLRSAAQAGVVNKLVVLPKQDWVPPSPTVRAEMLASTAGGSPSDFSRAVARTLASELARSEPCAFVKAVTEDRVPDIFVAEAAEHANMLRLERLRAFQPAAPTTPRRRSGHGAAAEDYEVWHGDGRSENPDFCDMGMLLPEEDRQALRDLIFDLKARLGRPPKVLEVGSWAGSSAMEMLKAGAERVTCVDTWEGNKYDDGCKAYDGSRGTPWDVFRHNMAGHPVTAYKCASPAAASSFKHNEFDLVYIDAEHDYDSVKADIEAWWLKARHALAGHDYYMPGVGTAVAGFARDCAPALGPTVAGSVWKFNIA